MADAKKLVCITVSEFESDTCSTLLTEAVSSDVCWLLSVEVSLPPLPQPVPGPSPSLSSIVRPRASKITAGGRSEGGSRGSITVGVPGSEVVAVNVQTVGILNAFPQGLSAGRTLGGI